MTKMKIKYTYRSDWYMVFLYGNIIIMMIVGAIAAPAARSVKSDEAGIVLGVFIVWLLIFIVGSVALSYIPTDINAGETSLKIKRLFKTTVIRYGKIKSIEITRELREPELRGDQRHYIEIMTIDIGEGDPIELCRKLDIDMEALVEHPEELKKQFDESEFNKLKQHIEDRMPLQFADTDMI